ncbi:MAG: hypothetical protein EXR11_01235 [Rhodospirillaceae bacterium]|nr:hypothetical protein [Rhodospirillaceae bacterium]
MSVSNKRLNICYRTLLGGAALLLTAPAWGQAAPPRAAPLTLMPPAAQAPVAAPASVTPGITVGTLDEVGTDRIGLIDESSGALPGTMWQDSDPVFVRSILPQIPRKMPSLAMRKLAQRLLLPQAKQPEAKSDPFALDVTPTAAEPPTGEAQTAAAQQSAWLLEARLNALAAMGDWNSVAALLELVPQDRVSEAMARLKVDGLLVEGKTDAACTEAQAALARQPDTHWQKLLVFCQFATKQTSAAQLGLSLLREQGVEDPAFFWAAELLQGNRPLTPNGLQRIAPLELAMLRATGRAFPDAVVRDGDPTMLRVLAEMPLPAIEDEKLTEAEKKDRARLMQDSRIVTAERAAAMGALDPEVVRTLYVALDLSQDTQPVQLAQATADNVRARAYMFQIAKAQTVPTARAEVMAKAIDLARADKGEKGPDLVTVARIYAPFLSELTPSPDLIWFAGHAARGLLAAGARDAALPWFELTRQMSRTSIEAAGIADGLWAVEHMAEKGSRGNITPQNIRAWQATIPAAGAIAPRERLLNLLMSLGDPISATDWLPVVTAPVKHAAMTPLSSHLWHALSLAARDANLGDTVALALVALGDDGPTGASPLTLNKVIESLMIVGREDDARALAAEAALVLGL